MDNMKDIMKNQVIDITKVLEQTMVEEKTLTTPKVEKATNPLKREGLKKLAKFKNTQLSKKFDINDLLR